ncbi:hypothetical protein C7B80_33185 [Cyanosarcina cf. burmensis CCALA 770]|nr:hypothetical protein C7B80_33185 [Cyanosarcina cf. burmensis CCALA 770]
MCNEPIATNNFEVLESRLASMIDNARSLDEIELALKSQRYIKSVRLADYLLKSNPPQRDFIVSFSMQDGSTVIKIVNIYDLGNQKFQFHKLRNQ